jgi:preprotein translocase subunit YajC
MSLFQLYVSFCQCLLWLQEPVASAPDAVDASGSAPVAEAGKAAAQEGARTVQEQPPGWITMAPVVILGLFAYFLMIRPQQREHHKRQEFLNNLKKNAKVVTTGGMIGTVVDISSDNRFVTLRIDDSTRIRFLRSAIQGELEEKSDTAPST